MIEVYDYNIIKPLFKNWQYNMIIKSIELGNTKPRMWVDDINNPNIGIFLKDVRMRIAGILKTEESNKKFKDFFDNEVLKNKVIGIEHEIVLIWNEEELEQTLLEMFDGHKVYKGDHETYQLSLCDYNGQNNDNLDYEIKDAVKIISDDSNYEFLDELKEEMCSESESVEAFSKNCFGYCAIKDNKIIGYCLSEYNNEDGFEVGIGVREQYRKQGIATVLANKLFLDAKERGFKTIGWGCFKKNLPSVKTALKLGFKKVKEYKTFYVEY